MYKNESQNKNISFKFNIKSWIFILFKLLDNEKKSSLNLLQIL